MNESLAPLEDPRLRALVRDIRAVLIHTSMSQDQKIIALFGVIDKLAPPPGPSAATRLALAMRGSGKPFTLFVAEIAGQEVRVKLDRSEDRPPDDRERRLLGRPGSVRYRTGQLYLPASGTVIAAITSAVVMFRLDPFAQAELASGSKPLGAVLAALPGARRETLEANETSDGRVRSSALMHAGGWPVALATELVTAEFAALAGSLLPLRQAATQCQPRTSLQIIFTPAASVPDLP